MLADLASLHPDVHTQEFWDFCARRELRFQRGRLFAMSNSLKL